MATTGISRPSSRIQVLHVLCETRRLNTQKNQSNRDQHHPPNPGPNFKCQSTAASVTQRLSGNMTALRYLRFFCQVHSRSSWFGPCLARLQLVPHAGRVAGSGSQVVKAALYTKHIIIKKKMVANEHK